MATTTAQIDIISIKEKNGIYTTQFWDESCQNENFSTIQISEDSLIDFIVSEGLNRTEYVNQTTFSLECDGIDERFDNPADYLENNMQSTIKEYIQFNS